MKKLYSVLMALMAVMGVSAQTSTESIPFTFCVNIDNPSVCYVLDSDYNRIDLVAGENVFEATYYKTTYADGTSYGYLDSFYLNIDESQLADYKITGCDVLNGDVRSPYEGFWYATTSLNLTSSLTLDMDGCTLFPIISNLEALRTATATVIVSDASKVALQCGYGNYMPKLVDGENIVKFDPINESQWRIGPAYYGEYLGGVTLNGVALVEEYGSYSATVAQGDVIVIDTQASDEPCDVAFSFTNAGTEKAVTAVYEYKNYTREEIANWADSFQVDMRGQIIVVLDMNSYDITSVTVNGVPQQLYSPELYITITENTEIAITASEYATYDINLTLSDPANVIIGVAESQYAGMSELTGLVSGTQTLQISDKMHYLIINPVSGTVIDKVAYTDGSETVEVEAGYSGYYVPIEAGTSVVVESHAIVREAEATLWINNIDKMYMLYLNYADGSEVFNTYGSLAPASGYQSFYFDPESDNPFSLYFSPTNYEVPGYVTLNGELVAPQYEGSTSYLLELNNGDEIRVYANEEYLDGIGSVSVDKANGQIYDMMGRKVNGNATLTPGIYVINGKKVIK